MILHYVFGMAKDFGGKPWSWIHHMSVVTAAASNRPETIYFWYEHEPTGEWWEASRHYLTLRKITAPREIHGRPLLHPAHQADVVRLQVLLEHGGAYLDSDVWCLEPFASVVSGPFWMGRQSTNYGLCNATMGGEPGAAFAREWLQRYSTFRSKGWDRHWDEHSVRVPLKLADEMPGEITILPHDTFFMPLWDDLPRIFNSAEPREYLLNSVSVHLWESRNWEFLSTLTPDTFDRESEIGRQLVGLGIL